MKGRYCNMPSVFFLHRIQKNGENITKGIEVHAALNDAIRSFWGRMKTGYNNPDHPDMTYVACFICDDNGEIYQQYNKSWLKTDGEDPVENKIFLHSIRRDDETYTKDITVYDTMDAARVAYATAMEYGYNNPRFPNVDLVACQITDMISGKIIESDDWVK